MSTTLHNHGTSSSAIKKPHVQRETNKQRRRDGDLDVKTANQRRNSNHQEEVVDVASSPDQLDLLHEHRDGASTKKLRRQSENGYASREYDYIEDFADLSDDTSKKPSLSIRSGSSQARPTTHGIQFHQMTPAQRKRTAQDEAIIIDDDKLEASSSTVPNKSAARWQNAAASSSQPLSTSREGAPPGRVKTYAALFEDNDQCSTEGASKNPPSGSRFVDFNLKSQHRPQPVKSRMKPKPGSLKKEITTGKAAKNTTPQSTPTSKTFIVAVQEWCRSSPQRSGDSLPPRGEWFRRRSRLLYTPAHDRIRVELKDQNGGQSDHHVHILDLADRAPLNIKMTSNFGVTTNYLVLMLQVENPDEDYVFLCDPNEKDYFDAFRPALKLRFSTTTFEELHVAGSKTLWGLHKEFCDEPKSKKRAREVFEPVEDLNSELQYPSGSEDFQQHIDVVGSYPPRRNSTRLARAAADNTPLPALDPEEIILIYPTAAVGAVNITNGDLKRLRPGEFLNDTLIEFGLKRWHKTLENDEPELASQIHIFSSFFYKKLNIKNHDEGFQSVRRWTLKMDIFSKRFIIIPINENLHWYLAIIYLPEYTLLPSKPRSPVKTPATRARKRVSSPPFTDINDSGVGFNVSDSAPSLAVEESTSSTPAEPELDLLNDDVEMNEVAQQLETSVILEEDSVIDQAPGSSQSSSMILQHSRSSHAPHTVTDVDLSDAMEVDEDHSKVTSDRRTPEKPETTDAISVDDAPEAPETPVNGRGGAPATRFYGRAGNNKRPSRARHSEPSTHLGSAVVERDSSVEVEENTIASPPVDDKHPWIFTLDSMGGTHKQVGNVLRDYLVNEAKDKKGNEGPNLPQQKKLPVPQQPNYCDCGLYLLHFAKMFVTQPEKYLAMGTMKKVPQGQLDREWDKPAVGLFRERLSAQIEELSGEWKETKKMKEAELANAPEGSKEAEESSDDEICLVEPAVVPEAEGSKKPVKRSSSKKRGLANKSKVASSESSTEASANTFKPPSASNKEVPQLGEASTTASSVSSKVPSRAVSKPLSVSSIKSDQETAKSSSTSALKEPPIEIFDDPEPPLDRMRG